MIVFEKLMKISLKSPQDVVWQPLIDKYVCQNPLGPHPINVTSQPQIESKPNKYYEKNILAIKYCLKNMVANSLNYQHLIIYLVFLQKSTMKFLNFVLDFQLFFSYHS